MIDLAKLSATPVARGKPQRFPDHLDEYLHFFAAAPKTGETIRYAPTAAEPGFPLSWHPCAAHQCRPAGPLL